MALYADRDYGRDCRRRVLRARGILSAIAWRGAGHGTGVHRWVVERTLARTHGFRGSAAPIGSVTAASRAGSARGTGDSALKGPTGGAGHRASAGTVARR
ncbi:hypothetical protein GCM10009787_28520 [Streptomyces bangladeshensis]|uniref:Transposase n=1 Tax=Streptomyces bangladeshensis TaxID=295352 RepID=A0ABN3BH62_9ACTN